MQCNFLACLKSSRGSSLIGAMLAVSLIGMAGLSVVQLSSSENKSSTHEMQKSQVMYVGQAGLEYAQDQLTKGLNPTVTGKPFGYGTFSVTTDPAMGLITVISQVGDATKTQSINANFAQNCVALDTSKAYTDQYELNEVSLSKTCNQAATVTSITLDWNWSSCVLNSLDPAGLCPNDHTSDHDHGNAIVQHLAIEGTAIYNPGGGVGTPTGGGQPGEAIDVADFTLTSNGTYTFEGPPHAIRFSQKHPGSGLYTVTVNFADGSQVTNTFQDGTAYDPGFVENTGAVTISPNYQSEIKVLGAEITYGAGGPEMPVTVELGTYSDVTADYTFAPIFNGLDVDGGEVHTTACLGAESEFVIKGSTQYGWFSAAYKSHSNTLQVKTLLHGEQAPPLKGFGGQKDVTVFLAPYLDAEGKVVLEANQVIMLFELGVDMSSNPTSTAADFQDLVILFTINGSNTCTPTDGPGDDTTNTDDTGTTSDDAASDTTGGTGGTAAKFAICHVPPGNESNPVTLQVSKSGWVNGHNAGHGIHDKDYLGSCTKSDGKNSSESKYEVFYKKIFNYSLTAPNK